MLLRVEKLVKIYTGRRVVDEVSFEINEGEIVGLLGRNGAGKTTTFKMTIGLILPTNGKVSFNSRINGNRQDRQWVEITNLPMYQRVRYGMGYLPQEPSVFQNLTVEENLLAILESRSGLSKGRRLSEAARLLNEYGLSRLARQKAYTLSGGEKRRLEICRALITSPSLILLDEPFSGVDPIAVNEIQDIIKKLKTKGISILLTDHNVRETLTVTDHSYVINEGGIICRGTPSEIMNDPMVRTKYLGERFRM
ncbi:MAG: LPS export ABC transporter ATP-binding protein [Planctomycetes bacterium]|nr:LPS export ABC transporter ATP-binding protein [Planctomycetota bacterium]